ncbi:glycosyltransferase family 2 protein [Pontibacter akesuensis]|uniref:Glycosyltransferase involved in cell wall bisynthesis n=1 Tax=Pontibacter akesuensis TaxID=388950 RepID=A0A1I7H4K9_9BACT|nr:glycosyltransferase family 2 protein [Pontibacter akesuensis]GHA53466.1 hypothetical protein GCM10007389_00800 [Pontibacter akesuensis]SFU55634.1 Glycosyltransferase involved in cell wall bisynthesis [Pontibacter akesuensis]
MMCSVIVANYNHADVILVALKTIEAQTYPDWEVIIVDDASTDNSKEAIDAFVAASRYKERYKVVYLSENMGVGHAKWTAAANSTGEVIAICDPDDAIHPEAVAKVMQAHARHPEASLVYTNYYHCDVQLIPRRIRENAGSITYSDVLEDKVSAFVSFKSAAYSKTAGFDSFFRLAEDKDLFYKLEEVGDIVYLDEPLYYYRIWPRGISQGFGAYVRSRDFRLLAIENAVARRKVSGIKQIPSKELQRLKAEIHLLQAEGILYSEQPLGRKFLKHLYEATLLNPTGSIKRKIKAALALSRVKRKVLRLLKKA